MQGTMSAQTVAVRPIDKGMILDRPSQSIEDGALLDARNFIAGPEGLVRRPGYQQFAGGAAVPYRPVDFITLWNTDGSQESILITEKTLWRVNPISVQEITWTLDNTGTVDVSGLSVTGNGTTWTSEDIMVGDILRVGSYEGVIAEITNDTTIVLGDSDIPPQTGASYAIVASFSSYGSTTVPAVPDWTVFDNKLIIVDGKRPPLVYDGGLGNIGYWVDNPAKYPVTGAFIPRCVTSYQDRVWFGSLLDGSDGDQRQRLRWSALADPRDFSIPTNYLDLPYVNAALLRIIPLGQRLMAYFGDAVFMGTPTNFPLLPVRFDPVETGSIGLIGPKAITSFLGGHFYIGQDDIYLMEEGRARRIGSPVLRETVKQATSYEGCYAAVDPWNTSVVFGFPRDFPHIQRLWRYNYRNGAWSYDLVEADMIANPVVNASLDWQDLTGSWDTLSAFFPTWDSMDLKDPRRLLFYSWGGQLWKQEPNIEADRMTTPIEAAFTTKDHDLGGPDVLKTWVRFGLKIDFDGGFDRPLSFTVQVSTNRGRVWKSVGVLTIRDGFDEGYINFRGTGSTCRFRLVTDSISRPYRISEYTLKVRVHGDERDVSTQE